MSTLIVSMKLEETVHKEKEEVKLRTINLIRLLQQSFRDLFEYLIHTYVWKRQT